MSRERLSIDGNYIHPCLSKFSWLSLLRTAIVPCQFHHHHSDHHLDLRPCVSLLNESYPILSRRFVFCPLASMALATDRRDATRTARRRMWWRMSGRLVASIEPLCICRRTCGEERRIGLTLTTQDVTRPDTRHKVLRNAFSLRQREGITDLWSDGRRD